MVCPPATWSGQYCCLESARCTPWPFFFNYKLNDKPEKLWYSTLRNQEQHSTERNYTMKTISSAIFYMREWQAIFQCEEYSFSEVRPYQDKQKNMIGLAPC